MEEILHHLGCISLVNTGINYISTRAGFLPSTVLNMKSPQSLKVGHWLSQIYFDLKVSVYIGTTSSNISLLRCHLSLRWVLQFWSWLRKKGGQFLSNTSLVSGFNPFEKYWSKTESSPGRGENKKYLKPPPRSPTDVSHLSAPPPGLLGLNGTKVTWICYCQSVGYICLLSGWSSRPLQVSGYVKKKALKVSLFGKILKCLSDNSIFREETPLGTKISLPSWHFLSGSFVLFPLGGIPEV